MLLILFILMLATTKCDQLKHHFKLDIGNPNVFCPSLNYTCSNGAIHYLCSDSYQVHPDCICYKEIRMEPSLVKTFLQGHNGIRNKVALNFGISNMNLLYWSEELSEMAHRFLKECPSGEDHCLILGEKMVRVHQNYIFTSIQLPERWPGHVVRHWYKDLGADTNSWEKLRELFKTGNLRKFINMVYPLAQFVGCGAAHVLNNYLIVCYYHPPYNQSLFPDDFEFGTPGTGCRAPRGVSSLNFAGLCGKDFEPSKATSESTTAFLISLCCLIVRLFQNY